MPKTLAPQRRRSLLRKRDFALIWSSGVALLTGSHAMFVVLPILVYERTRSPWATAMTVLCWALPPATIGQIAGVLADRVDRRLLLIWTNVIIAVLTGGYLLLEAQPWWTLALLTLVISAVGQVLGPAEHALIPEVVPRDRLGEGASLNALNNNIARLLGPAAGGVLYAAAGLGAFVGVKVALSLIAALLLIPVSAQRPFTPEPEPPQRLFAAWRAGIRIIWRHTRLRLVVALLAVATFGEGFLSALLAPLVDEVLEAGAETLGLILSAQAIGGIAGAWWATRITDRYDPLALLGVSSGAIALLLAVVFNYGWWYPHPGPAIVLTGLIGVPFAIFGAAQVLALQRYAPGRLRGRVFAAAVGLMSLTQLLGILLAGATGERWGPVVINVDVVAYLAIAIIAGTVVHGVRRRAHQPHTTHAKNQ